MIYDVIDICDIFQGEDSNRNDPKFFKINGIEKNNMHVTQVTYDISRKRHIFLDDVIFIVFSYY